MPASRRSHQPRSACAAFQHLGNIFPPYCTCSTLYFRLHRGVRNGRSMPCITPSEYLKGDLQTHSKADTKMRIVSHHTSNHRSVVKASYCITWQHKYRANEEPCRKRNGALPFYFATIDANSRLSACSMVRSLPQHQGYSGTILFYRA